MMDEAEQIHEFLLSEDFLDSRCRSWTMQMTNSIAVEITGSPTNCNWKVKKTDGSDWISSQSFPSWEQAKNDVRMTLKKRREDLLYEQGEPASVQF